VKATVAAGTAALLVAYFLAPLAIVGVKRGRTQPYDA